MTGKQLIEKAKNGDKLRKPQRLAAIRYLLEKRDMTNKELADIFNVSGRTISRDRKRLRQSLNEELLNSYGLAGDLFLEYRRTVHKLNELEKEIMEANERRFVLKDRWKVCIDFFDRVRDMNLEQRIRNLEEAVGIDGK